MRWLIVVLLTITVCVTAIAASDHWTGMWELDTAKSQYSPGPIPRSVSLRYEAVAGGVRVTNITVDVRGKSVERTTTFQFDGKDYPYTNNVNADTVSGRRINDHSFQTQWKKDGRPTLTQTITVAADLKTLTILQTGKDVAGNTVDNRGVYTKRTR